MPNKISRQKWYRSLENTDAREEERKSTKELDEAKRERKKRINKLMRKKKKYMETR